MRTQYPGLKSLLNTFGFASDDEMRARQFKQEPEPVAEREATIPQEILRARALMSCIESSGVKFPVQINDILEQTRAAYEQNRWTLQIDRGFYSTLSLLESVVRRRRGATGAEPASPDATVLNADNPGWTVIISNRRKVLDGNW
jgi:hypothetical protein